MDRIIKFRGKDTGDKWRFGLLCRGEYGGLNIQIFDSSLHLISPETVGQFTGFYDCDGNEIYEGDIIQNEVNPFETYQVTMVYGCWSAENNVDSGVLHWFLENAPFKVIGNIHDSKELLEGGKADD